MTNSRAPYTLYSNDAYRRPTDDTAPEAVSSEPEKNLPESEVTESSATGTESPEAPSTTSLHSVTSADSTKEATTESEAETTATPVVSTTTETEAGTPSSVTAEARPVEAEAETSTVASETDSKLNTAESTALDSADDAKAEAKVDASTDTAVTETAATTTEATAAPVATSSVETEPQFPSGIDIVTTDTETETETETEKAEPSLNVEAETKANHLPGAYLKNVREQKHLSMEHVADKLCLHHALMRNLEADDYERLPAPLFVRGYLRAYANLLEEPAEQVLALYVQQEQQAAPPPLTMHTTQTKRQTSSGDPWFKIISFGLFIGLMVLMTLWKLYPEQNSNAPTTTPLLPAPTANTEEVRPAMSNGQSLPLSSQPLSGMQPVPLSSNTGNNNIVYTPPEEDGAETAAATENTTVIASDGSTSNAAATETEAAATEETVAAESEATLNKLTLNLSADAWMQINDKDGKQLFLGTAQKGKVLDFEGAPPFKVRAGNFEGVSVTYKGEEKALADFPREGRRVYVIGGAQ